MPLTPGTRIGVYEVIASIGEGGMGQVYRATDTTLGRRVAIKILPDAFAADPERMARFEREAKTLASVNHPNIAALYGFEKSGGAHALVMELVEGEDLAQRIARGPIPWAEALPIASQIAEALEAAHEQGIVHRDLKPANIQVRSDGTVKVVDFGLAKALSPTDGSPATSATATAAALTNSPTLVSPLMTGASVILGSAAYMSPEQARGRAVDKRSDIWAFGAVLYEMLTGTRAFEGDTITDVLASVVKTTPNWTALPADTPPSVITLIQRCLAKERNSRVGDIAVARFLLADAAPGVWSTAGAQTVAAVPSRRQALPWLVAALLAGVAAATSIAWLRAPRANATPAVTRLQMSVLPADQLVGSIASVRPARTAVAISRDGRFVVFAAMKGTASQLYLRRLDQPEAEPISGTDGASWPFLSPDDAVLGFRADNKIKKVPVAGGPVTTICDFPAGAAYGVSWGEDGTIYFANRAGISKVPSAGGAPATVTTADASKAERQLLPRVLPGGGRLLFTDISGTDWTTANIVLLSLDTGERKVLIPGGADARYLNTGHLVYLKAASLMGVPFDLKSHQVTGTPVALVEGVMQAINAPNGTDETGAGEFAVSDSGTLLYVGGGIHPNLETSFLWVGRDGATQPLGAAPNGAYLGPRLSPDGQRLAVMMKAGPQGEVSHGFDLWLYDVVRGAPTRLTFTGDVSWPVWSPDGKRLVYRGPDGLFTIAADGGGQPERLTTGVFAQTPSSWSSTGNAIAFVQRTDSGDNGIWTLPLAGGARTPHLFLASRFSLAFPEFSPDERWMAYVSAESGTSELYVQPYPGPGEKVRISTAGATEPLWAANGRELLYRGFTPSRIQLFSAAVRSASPFRVDPPRLLFEYTAGEYNSTFPGRDWDASADGRFLMARLVPSTDKPVTTIQVVQNWTEELKRHAPTR